MIFGLHAVESLLQRSPQRVKSLWVQDGREDRRLQQVLEQAATHGVAVQVLPRKKLDEMAKGRHQGVIAEADTSSDYAEKDLLPLVQQAGARALVLILDGVTDPHNLGACLRSADAAGVTVVVAPKDKSASLNATVRKVACGAAEVMPFIAVTNLARAMGQLQDAGVWLVGLAGEADDTLYARDLRGPLALVMGAEGDGLRRLTRERCDFLAKLPMAGSVSSLNVSVATGICLYEVVRQRQTPPAV